MATISEVLTQIETFKKGVPFTLPQMKQKFGAWGGKMFYIGVMFEKIEPNGEYKAIGHQDWTTPYFVFV